MEARKRGAAVGGGDRGAQKGAASPTPRLTHEQGREVTTAPPAAARLGDACYAAGHRTQRQGSPPSALRGPTWDPRGSPGCFHPGRPPS